ncbi:MULTISPECIES: sugar ABC transporter ATP-binding protein [Agrobacterium]|uniref:Autoinducer 2 import ATP-binding protein LsrA n=1 Tax=Agrobacterium rosae TaxID=1972867 RepID=A0A1R3TND8_9HYPH|nr:MULTISPECIES: sugar ABC transporter ATP-binding protein [Agrobacterium]KAA3511628.1 sugar ABC transporter ATP-binding protein [Agrobacterium rosae]KAA3518948.1 sugar ABC transporter ATP-binding protein [Agrobacterium rosae]MBN7806776.1 sugar ABC transporter ATP-binding protein [Agrobacterium rosae]MCM2435194.1 sugar ABC transporter ATP-binding protein [Agrobacterium rosae]MDX8314168.1 sugar ABC transporter ATP-binding protein [Agrobacterium rosae]
MTDNAVLTMKNIRMRFGSYDALKGVSLSIRRGEVFGLLGQNGSGKSTMIKVLAGFHQPEPGSEIVLWGQKMTLPLDPMEIKKRGVAFVHQHLGLVPSLTVLENMRVTALGQKTPWFVNWRREAAAISKLFAEFDLSIDPFRSVADLPPVERAFVAIIRAFEDLRASDAGYGGEGILVLDEPTPFLPAADVQRLFALIRSIVKTGASVVIVTHDIDEVRDITDRVAVLRDGELVDILDTRSSARQSILDTIVGSRIDAFEKTRMASSGVPAAVSVRGLSHGGAAPFDFDIREGETLGVTGLIGSGFAALPYLLYGAKRGTGEISLGGKTVRIDAMTPFAAQQMGIAFLPGDRLGAAGVGSLSVTDNITFPVLDTLLKPYGLDRPGMTREAARLAQIHDVRPDNPHLPLGTLSGGNQQKVLLAKWLQIKPKLLMLDEPTQGVDFGARQQIFKALDRAAADGTAILCASTDNEQLEQICDRIIVFSRGRPVIELKGSDISRKAITEACFHSHDAEAAE